MTEKCQICYERDGDRKICKNNHYSCYRCYCKTKKMLNKCPYCRVKMKTLKPIIPVLSKRRGIQNKLTEFITHRHFLSKFEAHFELYDYMKTDIYIKYKQLYETLVNCMVVEKGHHGNLKFKTVSLDVDDILKMKIHHRAYSGIFNPRLLRRLYDKMVEHDVLESYKLRWKFYSICPMIIHLQITLGYVDVYEQFIKWSRSDFYPCSKKYLAEAEIPPLV